MAKLEFLPSGKFKQKGDQPRKVRSLRLTDQCWEQLGEISETQSLTRADLIEEIVKNKSIVRYLLEEEEDDNRTLMELLPVIIEGLYESNELNITSKDKAASKRAFQKLLEYLS